MRDLRTRLRFGRRGGAGDAILVVQTALGGLVCFTNYKKLPSRPTPVRVCALRQELVAGPCHFPFTYGRKGEGAMRRGCGIGLCKRHVPVTRHAAARVRVVQAGLGRREARRLRRKPVKERPVALE